MSGIESRSAAIRRGTVENDRITRRCTGVAAGGFSVLRASAGRNPVNAVVIPGRITSIAFRQVDASVLAGKSSFQFHRLF